MLAQVVIKNLCNTEKSEKKILQVPWFKGQNRKWIKIRRKEFKIKSWEELGGIEKVGEEIK